MKRILITGASGFVGTHLVRHFLDLHWHVTGLGTSGSHPAQEAERFVWVSADTTQPGSWQDHVANADVIVNLAGQNIFKRWTKSYKQAIYDSRVKTTHHLVSAMVSDKPVHLLSASAAGIYGDAGERTLTEESSTGTDFLAGVCKDWESAALTAKKKAGAVVQIMRFGVVLGDGGALSVMSPAFKWFAGGPLGSGYQWFPWIHIDDLINAMEFLIQTPDSRGIYNMVGPEPVRQRDFAKALGRALHRPALMPAPGFVVKLVMGELGASLLNSQKAVPDVLTKRRFPFAYPEVESALTAIFGKPDPG